MTATKPTTDLREAVRTELANAGMSQAQASKEAGIEANGGSKLNQWLAGKYAGDNEKIEAQLGRWLESRAAAQSQLAEMPSAPDWVETPTAEKIFASLHYARLAAVSVCVYGGAGVGKTVTCGEFARTHANVFVIPVTPAIADYSPCLRRIASVLGLREPKNNKDGLELQIIQRLTGTGGLLIFDEAQTLSNDALWGIKSIFDATRVGIAYIGSEQLYVNLMGRRVEFNAPIFRRISKKQALKQPTREDVSRLLIAWGITVDGVNGTRNVDFCAKIAAKPGALGMVTETLRMASMLALGAGATIDLSIIKEAYQSLGGE